MPGLHKDGREISLEISFLEFTKDEQRFFTGIIRKVANKQLQVDHGNRDLFSAIVNQASIGISVVDAKGHYTFVNNWFCHLLGRTREELLRMSFADISTQKTYRQIKSYSSVQSARVRALRSTKGI